MTESSAATNAPELTVSELAGALKRTIEDAYGRVRVRGELGRVTIAKSGHMYADLKDDRAVISTIMWKGQAGRLNFRPEEGLEVVVEGRLSTYPGRSQYQLIAETMAPAGVGALMALLEERKKKLAAEGLFASERKRAVPFLPKTIGVVTSPTGAVIRDILHRLSDRFPVHVLVWPVVVQGEQAANQVAAAISGFNQIDGAAGIPRPDVLIVARGGGSIEDLWGFNEEVVVRAAAASAIPLISAVGHETDWTLIDLAADVRAPTPTGAAEMAVPVRRDLAAQTQMLGGRLASAMGALIDRKTADARAAARGLPRPEDILGMRAQRLDAAGANLLSGLRRSVDRSSIAFQRLAGRLQPNTLSRDVDHRRQRVGELSQRMGREMARLVHDRTRTSEAIGARLESVSPRSVLARGYAIVHRTGGEIVRASASLKPNDQVTIEFADGRSEAIVNPTGGGMKRPRRPKAREGQGSLF